MRLDAEDAEALERARDHGLKTSELDGLVAAVSERRRVHHVLPTDRRDFSAVRVGARFERPLTLAP